MKKLLALILALAPSLALAQNAGWPPPGGAVAALGVYNTVAPTITNGQVNFLQTDANGNLNVNVKAGSGSGGAVTIASGGVASGAYASGAISDGANVTLGSEADAKSAATDTTPITQMQVDKQISFNGQNPNTASAINSTSTLTLPSTTTAYTVGQLICTSATVKL